MQHTGVPTRGESERVAVACHALGPDALPVNAVAARRCHALSAVLREPVLRTTLRRVTETYSLVPPSSEMELGQRIDSTLLSPLAQRDTVARLCREAVERHFGTVCVNSRFVSLAAEALEGSGVGVCASVAFPFGAMSTEAKIAEARSAIWDGASEIDLVPPLGLVKAGQYQEVFADILYVRQAVESPVKLRVVLETGLMTADEMVDVALIAVAAGTDAVKTSTGFLASGPSPSDVRLLRQALGGAVGIKVAGNIHTWDGARCFLSAGATRIATSHGIEIASGFLALHRLAGMQTRPRIGHWPMHESVARVGSDSRQTHPAEPAAELVIGRTSTTWPQCREKDEREVHDETHVGAKA